MEKLYHERQHLQFCAVHAMNNLFQNKDACSKAALDHICRQLDPESWINPHKSMLGIGNYDINVIIVFLNQCGYDLVWFDKRKDVDVIILAKVFGFMMNCPAEFLGRSLPLNVFKHWFVVREFEDQKFYNLDSKLRSPLQIGNDHDLLQFLRQKLRTGRCELLLVVKKEVSESRSWMREEKC